MLLLLASLAGTPAAFAQEGSVLQAFSKRVDGSRVSFDYAWSMQVGRTKATGEGTVLLQGNAFRMEGNGLDVRCDGKTLWTMDTEAEEVVIEALDPAGADYSANPALLVAAVDKAFREVSSLKGTFRGKAARICVLEPVGEAASVGGSGIVSLKLYFATDKVELTGAEFTMEDGTVSVFRLDNMKFSPVAEDLDAFRLDVAALDGGFVITDLRQGVNP